MGTTLGAITGMLAEMGLNHTTSADENCIRLTFSTEKYHDTEGDADLLLVFHLSEYGEYLGIFAPKAFNVEGPQKAVYLRTFMDIQSSAPLVKFKYDDEDGEVRPTIEFAIEDAEFTQLQLRKCITAIVGIVEGSYQIFHDAVQ